MIFLFFNNNIVNVLINLNKNTGYNFLIKKSKTIRSLSYRFKKK